MITTKYLYTDKHFNRYNLVRVPAAAGLYMDKHFNRYNLVKVYEVKAA